MNLRVITRMLLYYKLFFAITFDTKFRKKLHDFITR